MSSTNGHGKQQLAEWIRLGWKHPEASKFKFDSLLYERGRFILVLYTFAFALLGKEKSLQAGLATYERALKTNKNYLAAAGKVFGVSANVMKSIEELESSGPRGGKEPTEIAKMLERGEI